MSCYHELHVTINTVFETQLKTWCCFANIISFPFYIFHGINFTYRISQSHLNNNFSHLLSRIMKEHFKISIQLANSFVCCWAISERKKKTPRKRKSYSNVSNVFKIISGKFRYKRFIVSPNWNCAEDLPIKCKHSPHT